MPDFTQNFNRYSYALNNLINIIDPNGMDWYSAKNKEGQLEYKYSLDIQKDLDKVESGGKYLGKTYVNGDNYFSLFGSEENLKENQGKLTQKIDNAIMNYHIRKKGYLIIHVTISKNTRVIHTNQVTPF